MPPACCRRSRPTTGPRTWTAPLNRAVDAALARLRQLHPRRIDLSLDRLHRLLAALDHPERRLPPVLHVAGTNGKGSTVAFLRAGLEAAGARIHVYTSPHLVRFHERIRLAGRLIGDDALTGALEQAETANAGEPITEFEITTAAAFLAFAAGPADYLVLEVGLGGRLDATNVVDRPAVTAITRISIDHVAFLGDSIAAIAAEKAGIMKPDVPCIVGPQGSDAAIMTLTGAAERVGAPLLLHGRDWLAEPTADGFALHTPAGTRRYPRPALPGDHQVGNAGTALMALDLLEDYRVTEEAKRRGLLEATWPARLQRLDPAAFGLDPAWQLWLDGGHNDSAGEVLAAWAAGRAVPLHLVCGMLTTKAAEDFLRPLAPHAASLTAIPVPDEPASYTAEALAEAARAAGLPRVRTAPDIPSALLDAAGPPGTLLICGSLYLAGHVLALAGLSPA